MLALLTTGVRGLASVQNHIGDTVSSLFSKLSFTGQFDLVISARARLPQEHPDHPLDAVPVLHFRGSGFFRELRMPLSSTKVELHSYDRRTWSPSSISIEGEFIPETGPADSAQPFR